MKDSGVIRIDVGGKSTNTESYSDCHDPYRRKRTGDWHEENAER
jgi:hypothetical protein